MVVIFAAFLLFIVYVEEIKQLLSKYPYLTYLVYGGNDYVGIIQNYDDHITTIYDFGVLKTPEQKMRYLEFGEIWWWESNRLIPINVFLKQEWIEFRFCVKTMNSKDVTIQLGPHCSLKEMAVKRSKRKSITLVRKLP
jgi:hypothetical protein